jgi:hypothetical protein
MADTIAEVVTMLTEKRTALSAELRALTDELQRIDSALAALRGNVRTAVAQRPAMRRFEELHSRKRASGVKATIEEIMQAAQGQALHADQVLEAIRARGIQVSAQDPKATIVTALLRLAREREAKQLPEGVWKLPRNRWIWSDSAPGMWMDGGPFAGATGTLLPQENAP